MPAGGTTATYVAYGLSNFLWWRSFGNEQDDNGVLTLTFHGKRVIDARFAPSHLDDTGVPVPATGSEADTDQRRMGLGSRLCRPRGTSAALTGNHRVVFTADPSG